jgi:hypothetical protein
MRNVTRGSSKIGVPMVEQHISSAERRWLIKSVREMSGELYRQLSGVDEKGLRDAELLYQRQIETIVHGFASPTRLPHEPLDVLPSERDYVDGELHHFLYEYEAAREETVWLLHTLSEDEWLQTGLHPYRGEISVYDIARELHEHDLQHLNQARVTREALDRRLGR